MRYHKSYFKSQNFTIFRYFLDFSLVFFSTRISGSLFFIILGSEPENNIFTKHFLHWFQCKYIFLNWTSWIWENGEFMYLYIFFFIVVFQYKLHCFLQLMPFLIRTQYSLKSETFYSDLNLLLLDSLLVQIWLKS